MSSLTAAELADLRRLALAARKQDKTGARDWPGKPSAQRLQLFLAASPDVILRLLNMAEGVPDDDEPGTLF